MTRFGSAIQCVAVAVAVVALASACSTQKSDNSSAAPTPSASTPATLTASYLQPPANFNKYNAPGRPNVVFDPCTWIPDSAITEAGYDPSSRNRGPDQVAEQTFLMCYFKNSNGRLTIMSGNVSFAEDQQKNAADGTPKTVNGRAALEVADPADKHHCFIDFATKAGFVSVSVLTSAEASINGVKSCDNLENVAAAIEPAIGKDN